MEQTVLILFLTLFGISCSKSTEKPRVFVFTDINIDKGDPDDRQSLVHLFWYANFEGVIEIDAKADTWYEIEMPLTGVSSWTDKFGFILLFPGLGEKLYSNFYIDDIKLERKHMIPVTNLSFYDDEISVPVGEILKLSPDFEPANATNLNSIKWSSDNDTIVVIASNGTAVGLAKGKATITAKIGSVKASVDIIVE